MLPFGDDAVVQPSAVKLVMWAVILGALLGSCTNAGKLPDNSPGVRVSAPLSASDAVRPKQCRAAPLMSYCDEMLSRARVLDWAGEAKRSKPPVLELTSDGRL